jgi:hypothetical protein
MTGMPHGLLGALPALAIGVLVWLGVKLVVWWLTLD